VLDEVKGAEGEIILFIDEMHTLIGAGKGEGAMDASNLLKPALARGELHCIGATTLDEYQKYVEKDPALQRRFQPVFVGEPTVEDTISILRGLKDRYELHHGVRITDGAIVAAATLSNRYIADRFLPDKAIDLMDEAASRIRMEVESKPEEIEALDRRIIQLKIEEMALAKETDQASHDRLAHLRGDLANFEQQSAELTTRWQNERDKIAAEGKVKELLDAARIELEQAQRAGDYGKAGELTYSRIPELERQVAETQGVTANALLREEVTAEDIGAVVSKWTGIPVERMLTGERADGRGRGCAARGAPRARRATGPQPAARELPVPRPDRRRQDRAHQGARRLPVRRRQRHGPHRHERIHGKARGIAPDRRAAGLCRL
jgi:ATP-dependent Clp protease ATP-binding subunit ClpB